MRPLPNVRSAVRLLLALLLLALIGLTGAARAAPVSRVDSVGITVGDMDRALAFYTGVLPFKLVFEVEVQGDAHEHLFGVFGMRARIVRLRLGAEEVELIDYLAPEGRPVPVDSRSNDEWFQHIAIIVSDMDAAYARLRQHNVQHASSGPQTLPEWNPNAGGIKAFYFKDPERTGKADASLRGNPRRGPSSAALSPYPAGSAAGAGGRGPRPARSGVLCDGDPGHRR